MSAPDGLPAKRQFFGNVFKRACCAAYQRCSITHCGRDVVRQHAMMKGSLHAAAVAGSA
jgi:hypothetical protein